MIIIMIKASSDYVKKEMKRLITYTKWYTLKPESNLENDI